MKTSEETNNNFRQFFDETKEYVKLQANFLRVQSVEKLTVLISSLLIVMMAIVLLAGVLFYLFFTLAYALLPFVGGLAVSFGVITLLYIGLIALLFVFRDKLVVNPVLNLLMKLFYDKSDKDEISKLKGNDEQGKKPSDK